MSTERIWELLGRKLAGEASQQELQELEQLLREHPDLHLAVQTITDVWQQQTQPAHAWELEQAYLRHKARMKEQKLPVADTEEEPLPQEALAAMPKRKRVTPLLVSLGIIAGVVAAWFFGSQILRPAATAPLVATAPANEISTKNGSRTTIKLPDGTQVWLNAGSKLTYDKQFGNGLREVALTGEAFFDVVRNVEKPFVIHTVKMDIKVLGTQFDVKSYPGDATAEATLIHGSIEVVLKDRPAEKIMLKPNEKIVVTNSTGYAVSNTRKDEEKPAQQTMVAIQKLIPATGDSTIAETSWLYNKLIFRDEPFVQLAQEMERWYGVTIRFANKKKEQLRFTGTFQHETIQQALNALKLTATFSYNINTSDIVIK